MQGVQFRSQDTIVIVRHGKISASSKVRNAQAVGIKGLLIYADPAEVAQGGESDHSVYPQSWWMPSRGIRKDTVLLASGDPLSPGFPSLPEIKDYRLAMGVIPGTPPGGGVPTGPVVPNGPVR